tara:strand:+ start:342 stop:467 length:126 start_codon:yes stop_codon:yes gene_type:complete
MGFFSKLLDFIEALLIMFLKLAMVVVICGTILALGINYYGT